MPNTMLPIDRSNFPTLPKRLALMVIDCQNDFVAEDGPLRATDPEDYIENIVELAKGFRGKKHDVIWVRTEFSVRQIHQDEEIIASNTPAGARARGRPRSRREPREPIDPEAFLGIDDPKEQLCARKGTKGAELADPIKAAIEGFDKVVVKSHYSAFKSTDLVNLLRSRFVTGVYLCGSLFNIGVFATAIDLAQHGYDITLVDDCCGYRSPMRHSRAKRRVEELTGCNILNLDAALKAVNPDGAAKQPAQLEKQQNEPMPIGAPHQDDNAAGSDEDKSSYEKTGSGETTRVGDAATAKRKGERETEAESPSSTTANLSAGDLKGVKDDKSQDILTLLTSKLTLEGGEGAAEMPQGEAAAPGDKAAQPPTPTPTASIEFDNRRQLTSTSTSTSKKRKGKTKASADIASDESKSLAQPETQFHRKKSPDQVRHGNQASSDATSKDTPAAQGTADLEIGINKLSLAEEKEGKEKGQASSPRSDPSISSKSIEPAPRPQIPQKQSVTQKGQTPKDSIKSRPSKMAGTQTASTSMEKTICEGDTCIIHNLLPASLEDGVFEKLKTEVEWAKMSHQGGEVPRLVAVQGETDKDGNQPLYRHPSDESPPLFPFTPTVRAIKDEVEKHLNHPLNHVLIQWYRDGHDYISEHSDKTLDIVAGSYIANVSLGAQRTMVLRTKKQNKKYAADGGKPNETALAGSSTTSPVEEGTERRQAVRVPLPHNSLFKMGLQTNMRWLHGIRQDKRADRDKTEPELAYEGARISLTFRQIGTYMDKPGKMIWGQGATGKSHDLAHPVLNGQTPEAIQMLKAFGTENHASEFDWQQHYGGGFDVLNMYTARRLFMSPDAVTNNRVQLFMAELDMSYARGRMSPSTGQSPAEESSLQSTGTPIMFVDNDDNRTVVEGEMAIMNYLDQVHGSKLREGKEPTNGRIAKQLTRFYQAFDLLRWWKEVCSKEANKNVRLGKLKKALGKAYPHVAGVSTSQEMFIAGEEVTMADCAFFATLHEIVIQDSELSGGVEILSAVKGLGDYYDRFRSRKSALAVFGELPASQRPRAQRKSKGKAPAVEEGDARSESESEDEEEQGERESDDKI